MGRAIIDLDSGEAIAALMASAAGAPASSPSARRREEEKVDLAMLAF